MQQTACTAPSPGHLLPPPNHAHTAIVAALAKVRSCLAVILAYLDMPARPGSWELAGTSRTCMYLRPVLMLPRQPQMHSPAPPTVHVHCTAEAAPGQVRSCHAVVLAWLGISEHPGKRELARASHTCLHHLSSLLLASLHSAQLRSATPPVGHAHRAAEPALANIWSHHAAAHTLLGMPELYGKHQLATMAHQACAKT